MISNAIAVFLGYIKGIYSELAIGLATLLITILTVVLIFIGLISLIMSINRHQ
ncbi:hypothetical protein [Acidianus manzaensis]|uniref:hypothetical protein n=1 Tax=Acidianus manzaensis TaxID=282676 RepID=UPI00164FD41D|nr:hypothetical protein [Acidianus manzaensis]